MLYPAIGKAQTQVDSSIEALIRGLRSPHLRVRNESLFKLKHAGDRAVPFLIYALAETTQTSRSQLIEALQAIGPAARIAIPFIKTLLKNQPFDVRISAAEALGGLHATGALPELIEALGDPQPGLQEIVARSIQVLGPDAAPAIPKLVPLLASSDDGVRYQAAGALGGIGPAAGQAIPTLTRLLDDSVARVRANAAIAIGGIGTLDAATRPALLSLLRDYDAGVRAAAIAAFGKLGRRHRDAVPPLGLALADGDRANRQAAAAALEEIGPAARGAVRELVLALKDTSWEVREPVIKALDSIGPAAAAALPRLTAMVNDLMVGDAAQRAITRIGSAPGTLLPSLRASDLDNSRIQAMVRIGPGVIAQFLRALQDSSPVARRNAVRALSTLRPPIDTVLHALVLALSDSDEAVGMAVEEGLGAIGATIIPELKTALRGPDPRVRQRAAVILGRLGTIGRDAKDELSFALQDTMKSVRGAAAYALVTMGLSSPRLIAPLIEALNAKRPEVRLTAAVALRTLAVQLEDAKAISYIAELSSARDALAGNDDPHVREQAQEVRRAVERLSSLWWDNVRHTGERWIAVHWKVTGTLATLIALLVLWELLLFLKPLWLLGINEAIQRGFEVAVPSPLGGIQVPFRYAILVGFFQHHHRVLDAWVKDCLPHFKAAFGRRLTVNERSIHVPTPIAVDGVVIATPGVEDLRSLFSRSRNTVLICGEGGVGKTSLACQIAWWSMEDVPSTRLIPGHAMLPVLIEYDLEPFASPAASPLLDAVRGQLSATIGAERPASPSLVASLIRTQRVLVLIDHLSELSDGTRRLFRADEPDAPINA